MTEPLISAKVEFKPGPVFRMRTDGLALKGLVLGGEYILKLSNDRVPIEEGTLERSGRVTDDGREEVAVSYDTPYARRQHEDMSLHHDAGRSAKFLETAAHEAGHKVKEIIAAAVRKELGT